MYCIGSPPLLFTAMVGCSETVTLACEYFLVHLVKASAISFCERSRSSGFLSANRTLPLLTDAEAKPGAVMTKAIFFSGIESSIK